MISLRREKSQLANRHFYLSSCPLKKHFNFIWVSTCAHSFYNPNTPLNLYNNLNADGSFATWITSDKHPRK